VPVPFVLPSLSSLLVGDEGSGKSSLVARLQGRKLDDRENPLGTGLEYAYVNVKDTEQEGKYPPPEGLPPLPRNTRQTHILLRQDCGPAAAMDACIYGGCAGGD